MARAITSRPRMVVLLVLLVIVAGWALTQRRGGRGPLSTGGDERLSYSARRPPQLLTLREQGEGEMAESTTRNPFAYGARPSPTPRPTRRAAAPRPTLPPRPTPTPRIIVADDGSRLPPPPRFDREFIGHFGPVSLQVAAFRRAGSDSDLSEVEVATVGEVMDSVFIVRRIEHDAVVIGFVGYPEGEITRVPLSQN